MGWLYKGWQILRIVGLLACFSQNVEAEGSRYPFKVESTRIGNSYQIVAHNQGAAPVSVVVSMTDAQNVSSGQTWPVIGVVQPYSEKFIGMAGARDLHLGYSFKTTVNYRLGDLNAHHDPAQLYRLPYLDGKTFTIAQAPSGPITTHTTPESRNAIDIAMPEGSLVLAARDGVVIDAQDGYTEGGKDPRLLSQANDVRLVQDDGTIATYAHLMPRGANVSMGQHVKAGEVIGFAGSTGYSSGPHLHFAVTRVVENNGVLSEISVPVSFYVGSPPLVFEPRAGLRVTADYVAAVDPQQLDKTVTSRVLQASPIPMPTESSSFSVIFLFIANNWSWLVVLMLIFGLLGIWNWLEARTARQEEMMEELRKTWRQ
ncbi:peptidase M23 [Novimethylophilus kurashikiensis]|uniref:Peptidase M23 n=1 Tax=Novimethylophilus kurashikiensis TaxID=1825523 RepID=A0A2R5FAX8_9PROT|nr:M23 family metallopeptidase [Novimethylophilus kurashikiensis]GBG15392.1 peptidase M23 [Novimethylophilus kurashikiensis]